MNFTDSPHYLEKLCETLWLPCAFDNLTNSEGQLYDGNGHFKRVRSNEGSRVMLPLMNHTETIKYHKRWTTQRKEAGPISALGAEKKSCTSGCWVQWVWGGLYGWMITIMIQLHRVLLFLFRSHGVVLRGVRCTLLWITEDVRSIRMLLRLLC